MGPTPISVPHGATPALRMLVDRINGDGATLAFFARQVAQHGGVRWQDAVVVAGSSEMFCLLPLGASIDGLARAVLAVSWSKGLKMRVITGDGDSEMLRLAGLIEYVNTGRQALVNQGIWFNHVQKSAPQVNGTRAAVYYVSICYEWFTCRGDGWGNCVGPITYHSDCVTESIFAGGYDYGAPVGAYPGQVAVPPGGAAPSVPAALVVPPPRIPIADPADYLKCFSLEAGAVLTVYADQPTAGYNDPISISGGIGHAFLAIEQGQGASRVRRTVGFYAATKVEPFKRTSAESQLGDDHGHDYDVSLSYEITAAQLRNVIDAIVYYPIIYDLAHYNCTDFVLDVAESGGLFLPRTKGWWIVGSGSNPGDFGQDLRKYPNAVTRAGFAAANEGDCD